MFNKNNELGFKITLIQQINYLPTLNYDRIIIIFKVMRL